MFGQYQIKKVMFIFTKFSDNDDRNDAKFSTFLQTNVESRFSNRQLEVDFGGAASTCDVMVNVVIINVDNVVRTRNVLRKVRRRRNVLSSIALIFPLID